MEEYKELDDPVDEVYRIRLALLEEYGELQGYFRHLDEVRPKGKRWGFVVLKTQPKNSEERLRRDTLTI